MMLWASTNRSHRLVSRSHRQKLGQPNRPELSHLACPLGRMRVDLTNQIRGVLKPFSLVAGKGGSQPFIYRVRELVTNGPLKDVVEALLTASQAISQQIGLLTRRLMALARLGPSGSAAHDGSWGRLPRWHWPISASSMRRSGSQSPRAWEHILV